MSNTEKARMVAGGHKQSHSEGLKMSDIEKAQKAVDDFLKKALKVKDVKLVKAIRSSEGWECIAEVYEESSFIKALGLPTRVQDRNFYFVKLNDSLEVDSYGRKDREVLEEK